MYYPEVKGYVIVHDHMEGEGCRPRSGLLGCRYEPNIWTALLARIARVPRSAMDRLTGR